METIGTPSGPSQYDLSNLEGNEYLDKAAHAGKVSGLLKGHLPYLIRRRNIIGSTLPQLKGQVEQVRLVESANTDHAVIDKARGILQQTAKIMLGEILFPKTDTKPDGQEDNDTTRREGVKNWLNQHPGISLGVSAGYKATGHTGNFGPGFNKKFRAEAQKRGIDSSARNLNLPEDIFVDICSLKELQKLNGRGRPANGSKLDNGFRPALANEVKPKVALSNSAMFVLAELLSQELTITLTPQERANLNPDDILIEAAQIIDDFNHGKVLIEDPIALGIISSLPPFQDGQNALDLLLEIQEAQRTPPAAPPPPAPVDNTPLNKPDSNFDAESGVSEKMSQDEYFALAVGLSSIINRHLVKAGFVFSDQQNLVRRIVEKRSQSDRAKFFEDGSLQNWMETLLLKLAGFYKNPERFMKDNHSKEDLLGVLLRVKNSGMTFGELGESFMSILQKQN